VSSTYAALIAQGRANIEACRAEATELARYKVEVRRIRDEERATLSFLASPEFAKLCEEFEWRAAQGANTPAPVLRADVPASRVPAITMTAASLVVVFTLCLVCGYQTWLALALASASGGGTYDIILSMRK